MLVLAREFSYAFPSLCENMHLQVDDATAIDIDLYKTISLNQ